MSNSDDHEKHEKQRLRPAADLLRSDTSIKDKAGQTDWRETQKQNILAQGESATDMFYKSGNKPQGQKFELVDSDSSPTAASPKTLKGRVEVNQPVNESHSSESAVNSAFAQILELGRKFAALPIERRTEIILNGLQSGIDEFRYQESERLLGAAVGTTEGAGTVAVNLAKIADFSAYCIIGDKARAGKLAEDFGVSVGQTIVAGINLFDSAKKYSSETGASGDYGRPLRDLWAVGTMLDQEWSKLAPREQERVKYEFLSQLAAESVSGTASFGVAGKIGKAIKFTEILDVVAEHAALHGRAGFEQATKISNLIAQSIHNLIPKELVAEGGLKISMSSSELEKTVMQMVGPAGRQSGELSLFLAPGRNKVLNAKELAAFGGSERLEAMSAGELAEVGLRRYDMPRLKLDRDSYSIKATIPEHPMAYFRAEVPSPGVVKATDLFKGTLPEGTGCHLMASALKGHGRLPTRQLVLCNITNVETRAAFFAGALPEDTLVAKSSAKALKLLGLEAKAYRYEWDPMKESLNIVIDTGLK